jgi:hypothetical protein
MNFDFHSGENGAMKAIRAMGMATILLTVVGGAAWGGSDNRLGTNGALELRLPVDAREIAMAGADLGSVQGVQALFYNPAGVAESDSKTEVSFTHTNWIANMNINYVGVAQSIGGVGTLGLSAKVLSVGDIPFTSESAPDGNGEVFSPTFSTLGLTYARRMTDRVNFGGTVYYISERIMQETAAGLAFDFGFQYDTDFRGIRLGMSMRDFGPNTSYAGSDFDRLIHLNSDDPQAANRNVSLSSASFELPSSFQFSLSMPLVRNGGSALMLHGLYESNSFASDDGRVGAEFMYRKLFALRAGYKITTNSDDLFGLSYGAGVRVPLGNSALWLDYAGQTVSNFFDDVQNVSLTMKF